MAESRFIPAGALPRQYSRGCSCCCFDYAPRGWADGPSVSVPALHWSEMDLCCATGLPNPTHHLHPYVHQSESAQPGPTDKWEAVVYCCCIHVYPNRPLSGPGTPANPHNINFSTYCAFFGLWLRNVVWCSDALVWLYKTQHTKSISASTHLHVGCSK